MAVWKNRRKRKSALLYIPAALLFLMVITNDLHQLVFTFPSDVAVWSDSNYGYAFGYGLIVIFMPVCAPMFLVTLNVKCRQPSNRLRVLPSCLPIWQSRPVFAVRIWKREGRFSLAREESGTLANADSESTTFSMPASDVEVKATYKDAEATVSYGDLNGDGKVNLLDLIAMRKYLAKWDVSFGPQK